jgi:hypothetical protein
VIYQYDSPLTYSLIATNVPLSTSQAAAYAAAGYKNVRTTQDNLFFGERGAGEFEDQHQFDFGLTYAVPILGSLAPWVKLEVYNVANSDALRGFDTVVTADANSPKDAQGLPTGFIQGANFGNARSITDYQVPREYRLSAGFRF